jgi:hypothetical protein
MITSGQYRTAIEEKEKAEKVINLYHVERAQEFKERMKNNPVFTEDELIFSAADRCICGYGLAYPVGCGFHHYWDCAGILLGKVDTAVLHTDKLPFLYYDVKSESEHRGTTRGSVVPRTRK